MLGRRDRRLVQGGHASMKQRPIPQSLRDKLLVECGHRCIRCSSDAPEVDLHHITPVSSVGHADSRRDIKVSSPKLA